MLRGEKRKDARSRLSSVVAKTSALGSLINQRAVAVLTNHVQALMAPLTTQANRSPEESRRREFAHLGLRHRCIRSYGSFPEGRLDSSISAGDRTKMPDTETLLLYPLVQSRQRASSQGATVSLARTKITEYT
jgi:hypothetical protein